MNLRALTVLFFIGTINALQVRDDLIGATLDVLAKFFSTKTSNIYVAKLMDSNEKSVINDKSINELLEAINSNFTVKFANKLIEKSQKFNLIFVESNHVWENEMKMLNEEGFHLIILTDVIDDPTATIQKIFNKLYSYYVVNVNIIVKSKFHDKILMFTYYPFGENHCEKIFAPHLLDEFSRGSFGLSNYFPQKAGNFHKCSLKFSTVNYSPFTMIGPKFPGYISGINGEIIKTAAEALNFTLNVIETKSVFTKKDNGNVTIPGSLNLVEDGEANFTSWAISFKNPFREKASRFYYYSKLVFLVPPGPYLSSFEVLMLPFENSVWIAILILLLSSYCVVCLLRNYKKQRDFLTGRNNEDAGFNVIGILLRHSVVRSPFGNFARFLLILYIFYGFIISNLYEGKIFDYLEGHQHLPHANTVDEMIKRDFDFYVGPISDELVEDLVPGDK